MFSGKNKKKIINLSSAESAYSMISIKQTKQSLGALNFFAQYIIENSPTSSELELISDTHPREVKTCEIEIF